MATNLILKAAKLEDEVVVEVLAPVSPAMQAVTAAMEQVQGEIAEFAATTQEAEARVIAAAVSTNAQTEAIVSATASATKAAQTIALDAALAKQRAQRNVLAIFNAAGGQGELLEEATKQFAASERIDAIEEEIDRQRAQKHGFGIFDSLINNILIIDERADVLDTQKDQVRAERNIGAIARITQEAHVANQLTTITATDASILAGQRLSESSSRIAIAEAELRAIATNAQAFDAVLAAKGKVLDAHIAGYKILGDLATLDMRQQELDIRIQQANLLLADAPERRELLELQLKAARREDVIEMAGLPGRIEADQIKLENLRSEAAAAALNNPKQARILAAQADALEISLVVLEQTFEKEIIRQNAVADLAVIQYRRDTDTPAELAASINLGRAKTGLPPVTIGQAGEMLRNPNTSEIAGQWLMSGTSDSESLGNSAAESLVIRINAEAAGASIPSSPATKAQDIIRIKFAEEMATLEAANQAPDTDEGAKAIMNAVARKTMSDINNSPISDTDLNNPYLLPPKESLARSAAVVETLLWRDQLVHMDVDRLDTKLIWSAAVNLVRLGKLTPEQATLEFIIIFKQGIDQNAQLAGGWNRVNLPPQTKYILELPKAQHKTSFDALLAGSGTLASATLAEVSIFTAGIDVSFLQIMSDLASTTYRFDAIDYTSTFNNLNRDIGILGRLSDAELEAAALPAPATPIAAGE